MAFLCQLVKWSGDKDEVKDVRTGRFLLVCGVAMRIGRSLTGVRTRIDFMICTPFIENANIIP